MVMASLLRFAAPMVAAASALGWAQTQRGVEAVQPPVDEKQAVGDYYALVIGIDDYQAPMNKLTTAVNDAKAMGKLLEEGYGFKVQHLLDHDATRFNILDALAKYETTVKPPDSVLVYYAGHGYLDQQTKRAYWIPVDANSKFSPNRIISDDLMNEVSDVPARHVLVISDSCYSGDMATRGIADTEAASSRSATIARMAVRRSRNLMASGGDEPVADAGGNGHSIFANVLLRSLNEDDQAMFTGSAIFYQDIKDLVVGNSRQTPEYAVIPDSAHDGGDFVFVRTGKAIAGGAKARAEALAAIKAAAVAEPASSGNGSGSNADLQKMMNSVRMTLPNLSAAVASADVKFLNDALAAGVQPTVMEQAFRQKSTEGKTAAQAFFENAGNAKDAMDWLKAELGAGLDPNMTVPDDYYEQSGLLNAAMRAGNVGAIELLLKNGASPHAYQNLFLTRYDEPRFLYPLQYIASDDRLDLKQKQELAKAFLDAGVVVPKPAPETLDGRDLPVHQAEEIQEKTATALGMKLPLSPECCRRPGPVCMAVSKRSGEDWCALVAKMPTQLEVANPKMRPIWGVRLRYLMSIENNKAYFLGSTQSIGEASYVLVEVSKDSSSWTILQYMEPESGMGLCKKDDQDDNAPRAEYCWRRIPLHRVAGTDEMQFDEWGVSWKLQP